MAAAPPSLPDDLIQEILLRFPTDDPTCLLRSSLVCKDWSSVISRPHFRRRLHEIHRAPPLLGFLDDEASERTSCFIPTTASSFSLAAPDHRSWRALDCRHGRALFLSRSQDAKELLVWEPISGTQECVPLPVAFEFSYSAAAVLCAVDGCDHRDCLGGPFCVLFIFSSKEDADEYVTLACAYSTEIGAWGGVTTMHGEFIGFTKYSSVLIDNSLLYFIVYDYVDSESILEYDLSRHVLTIFSVPDSYCDCTCTLMVTEDGGLGLIQDLHRHLKLWTREASDGADAKWLLSRVIYPHNLLPTSAWLDECYIVALKGFVEGANAIFVSTVAGLFAIDLQSEQARKVSDHCGFSFHKLVPIVTFYTPAPRGNHQNQLVSKPSEEACSGEGGKGEKTIHQAQQLFNKGSNAINEVGFVNTFECISHDNNVRVPHHGEVALGCAATFKKYRCTYNAQEVNDSLDDVPKSASSEESLKGTCSKDDGGDSNTSGSNVEVAAPSSEKGDSQEGRGFKGGNVRSLLNLLQKRLATDCSLPVKLLC